MNTTVAPQPTTDHSDAPGPLVMLRGLALDVGLPVLAYYVLHLLGASDWALCSPAPASPPPGSSGPRCAPGSSTPSPR